MQTAPSKLKQWQLLWFLPIGLALVLTLFRYASLELITPEPAARLESENIARLVALHARELPSTAIVFVRGYRAAGDGGDGFFRWAPRSHDPVDGGTVLAPAAGVGRWIRLYSGAINVRWFGAVGDGAANDRAALLAAASRAASNGTALELPPGTYRIAANTDLSVPLLFHGGILSVDTATTVILKAAVSAPSSQIFTGPGSVAFETNSRGLPLAVLPEWFGALKDGSSNDGPAIQRALTAAPDSGLVQLSAGTYAVATPLSITKAMTLRGLNMRGTHLLWNGGVGVMLTCEAASDNVHLEDFAVGNVGTATHAIKLMGVRSFLSRLFSNSRIGFSTAVIETNEIKAVYHVVLRDCAFHVLEAKQETPCAVVVHQGHTIVVDGCMFSGFSDSAIKAGTYDGNSVHGLSVVNSRLESFSGQTSPYPGGANSVGISVDYVLGLNVTGCNFEMGSDEDRGASPQCAIRLRACGSGQIAGNAFSGGGVCTKAIDITDQRTMGLSIQGNMFYRINGYAIVNTGSGTLAAQEIGMNGTRVTSGVWDNSFTPSLIFSTDSSGLQYSVQAAKYQRRGNFLDAYGTIKLTTKGSASGAVRIAGLPQASRSAVNATSPVEIILNSTPSTADHLYGLIMSNENSIRLMKTSHSSATEITSADLSDHSEIYFHAIYQADP